MTYDTKGQIVVCSKSEFKVVLGPTPPVLSKLATISEAQPL